MAERAPSMPSELLELLRADHDDLLDFANLEWVLDEAVTHPGKDSLGLQEVPPVASVLDGPVTSSSSGSASHDSLLPHAAAPWAAAWPAPVPDGMLLKAEPASAVPTFQPHVLAPPPPAPRISSASGIGAPAQPPLASRSSFSKPSASQVTGAQNGEFDGSAGQDAGPGPKKKRTRNEQQMQQNRVAQQKYRERKKAEHEALQNALDQLTAQLATLKALEAQTSMLTAQNQALSATVSAQAERITELTLKVETQAAALEAERAAAAQASALASSQQHMILDQHSKLRLQEEVIEQLRGRLRDKVDEAFAGHDPKAVCQRMVQAVRDALAGARNVEGLQEVLEKLPEDVITAICKSILCEVKQLWPELGVRLAQSKLALGPCPASCSQQMQAAFAQ